MDSDTIPLLFSLCAVEMGGNHGHVVFNPQAGGTIRIRTEVQHRSPNAGNVEVSTSIFTDSKWYERGLAAGKSRFFLVYEIVERVTRVFGPHHRSDALALKLELHLEILGKCPCVINAFAVP